MLNWYITNAPNSPTNQGRIIILKSKLLRRHHMQYFYRKRSRMQPGLEPPSCSFRNLFIRPSASLKYSYSNFYSPLSLLQDSLFSGSIAVLCIVDICIIIQRMGNVPQTINIHGFKKNSNLLLNIKLAKLRDYFAAFKSICDNFSIDLTEFEHIFGTGQSAFVIWDTDNNGLIDSLELFAGIAIFADIKMEDKMRFLFDMFDFNEIDYLEHIELEFMVFCACSASFKIFSITNEIRNQEIEDFVKDMFFDSSKITVADLIKKARENKKIQEFFEAIKFDKNSESNINSQSHMQAYSQGVSSEKLSEQMNK